MCIITVEMADWEQNFCITGMSCAACSARVERAVGQLNGMKSVQVNLLMGSMRTCCTDSLTDAEIIAAVEAAGYGATIGKASHSPQHENAGMKHRFLYSAAILLPLMLLHHLWHGSIAALVQLVLTLPILWLNRSFFINGTKSVLKGSANMDTLVALGAMAAVADGTINFLTAHRDIFYFECAAMILTFITLGKWLESKATGRTGAALEKLSALMPRHATVLRNGEPCTIPATAVDVGDIVSVRAGDRIPVDGTIIQGNSSVDESALTGESIPAEKYPGCNIYAGCINRHGTLQIRADKTCADSALAAIINLVSEAAATKAPIARIADRISGVFVPIVVSLAMLTAGVWLWIGEPAAFAVSCAIAVLVVSCPCALGLATPVAIMVGMGKGAENGILFRTAEALETLGHCDCVLLDKTGTITGGNAHVTDILPAEGFSEHELMQLAVSIESTGNHPLAQAILNAGKNYTAEPAEEHIYHPGKGICATIAGHPCAAGNAELMRQLGICVPSEKAASLATAGKTPLFFTQNGQYVGMLAVADTLKPESAQAVEQLHGAGLQVVMLTGDNILTAAAVAKQAGLNDFYADLSPQDKEQHLRRLQEAGHHVAMAGDGINDAPALMRADVGIAIGNGTDIAIESAAVTLVHGKLTDLTAAWQLSRAVVRNIHQNFFWALLYNCLAIPQAAGVLYPLLGWQLHPAIAAAAMGLSSFCVVTNALRLRHIQLNQPKTMNTITIKVDGMMCPHCEAHITKALLGIPGVVDCKADHKAKHVTVTLYPEASVSELHATIRAQGYTVIG